MRKRRLKALIEAQYMVLLGKFWGYYDFEYVGKNTLRFWKARLRLIKKDMRPMTKKHINFWWSQQPFRLNLKGYQGNCITCYKKSNNKLYQIAKEQPEAFGFFSKMEKVYGNVDGKVPQRIEVEYWDEDNQEFYTTTVLETLAPEEYKNTIFRSFRTADDIIEESKNFNKEVQDDHIKTESCEIFSGCGE